MTDAATMTREDILAIPLDSPERLYSADQSTAESEYRRLARAWHPDRNPGVDPGVFAHISVLYERAVEKLKGGRWVTPGELRITSVQGREYCLRYRKAHPFELGQMYIGEKVVAFDVGSDYADLVGSAQRLIESFTYPSEDMRREHSRYLPQLSGLVEHANGHLIVMRKEPDQFLLRDVLDHFKGRIEPRHVAWVLSSLYNLNCYLKIAGITHNDIGPNTYFISPRQHNGALLGGWWYAARLDAQLTALPSRTLHQARPDVVKSKRASAHLDADLIRATGRELLGDSIGARLQLDKTLPAPLVTWLRSLGIADAIREYTEWYGTCLPASFGPRRYVEMKIEASDIYPPIN